MTTPTQPQSGNQEALAAERTQGSETSLAAHTPGPWVRNFNDNWISTSDGKPIVMCARHPLFFTEEEWKANAALVEAAPALLAELHRCSCALRTATAIIKSQGTHPGLVETNEALITAACSAIALASGGKQG